MTLAPICQNLLMWKATHTLMNDNISFKHRKLQCLITDKLTTNMSKEL